MFAAIGLALATILALIMRTKASAGRKQRLKDAKTRLDAGIEALNIKRVAVESAQAHERLAEEARKAGEVRRELENQEPDATDAAGSKYDMDDELDK